jgi:hypothetical protein
MDYHWDRLRSYLVLPSHARRLVLSCVVSCDVSVKCCVALFCVVPRPSDTSIVVLGFVTHSTVREELQSCLRYVYILRT